MSSKKKSGGYKTTIYANMDWFSAADQPPSMKDLPTEFSKAQKLWKKDGEENLQKIIALLQPYLRASLVLDNISNWDQLFDAAQIDDSHEISPYTNVQSRSPVYGKSLKKP